MSAQLPLSPLTSAQIAERQARVIDILLELDLIDGQLAEAKAAAKLAREPLIEERERLLAQIRETQDANLAAQDAPLVPFGRRAPTT